MRKLLLLFSLIPALACPVGCDSAEDDDPVANPDCEPLIAEIYDECGLTIPDYPAAAPGREEAIDDCKENRRYDWACIDVCVVDHRHLCTSLNLCLEDCR